MVAQAQWAGEDKYIMKGQSAHIGKVEPGVNACYTWDGPNIISDIHQAVVTVKPESDTVYKVSKIDTCGVWEDDVAVFVVDSATIVRVIPKNCYHDGDSLKPEDFIIVTVPSGYANQVKITPSVVSLSSGLIGGVIGAIGEGTSPLEGMSQHATREITFTLEKDGHTSTKKVNIEVYRDEPVATPTLGVAALEAWRFGEKCKAMAQLAKELGKPMEVLNPDIFSTGCSLKNPSLDFDVEFPMPMPITTCCEGEPADGFNLTGPTSTLSIGYDCDFPVPGASIPPCIPFLKGGIYFTGGIQGGIQVKAFDIQFRGWKCSQIVFPMEIFFEAFGGAKAAAVNDSILSLAIKLVGHASVPFSVIVSKNGVNWGGFKGVPVDISLLFEAKMHGLIPLKIPLPLGSFVLFDPKKIKK